jgi:preprotein translocase subunit SecY
MGASASAMASAMSGGKLTELKQRLLFVLVHCWSFASERTFRCRESIRLPWRQVCLNSSAAPSWTCSTCSRVVHLSGSRCFALGIMPYISASIIIQLLTKVSSQTRAVEQGRGCRKAQDHPVYPLWGRCFWLPSRRIGVAVMLETQMAPGNMPVVIEPGLAVPHHHGHHPGERRTMFLMWLGEQVTERGIGNGISLIIFAGYRVPVCPLPSAARLNWRAPVS